MRAIVKGNEPACLTQHRAIDPTDYANYGGKTALRVALVSEQRGLCCYCMSPIAADGLSMRIEHWQSQSGYPNQRLVYANLLAACRGGEGGNADQYHCDKLKDDQDLKWNPATPAHAIEARLKYRNNGEIVSDDPELDEELNTILGLNIATLKNRRKGVLDGLIKWWQMKQPNQGKVRAKVNQYETGAGNLEPYSPVAIWFLKRKLAT
ncbi:uncharacterized protein (TIGR02646 family) [Neorhizobium galegae]|uniref:TIGR02646 family protein n=1 Tax=Neorhizobium galegae TaxID=399 RepID=UPI001AE3DF6C|nr:TIGR02646 family protein [Neorhizobium galegae]MBP2549687.1 uncharacterized protein (TIGR02646 family) [Neorhizobium galegae]